MSGSEERIQIHGMYQVPRGDHRFGVVFYRLHEADLTRDACRDLIEGVAHHFAQEGPFVVRTGFRPDAEPGVYWVGLNDLSCAVSFEGALRAIKRSGRTVRMERQPRVPPRPDRPEDVPNPELRPVIDPGRVVQIHAAHVKAAQAPDVPTPPARPRPERPRPTGNGGGPFALMKATRAELGETSLAKRFRRGARGRRDEQPTDDQE